MTFQTPSKATLRVDDMTLLFNASTIPSALMAAALHEQDFLCRIFGRCLAGDPIDREVSDVIRQGIPGVPKLFTYARYNPDFSREGLATIIGPLELQRAAVRIQVKNTQIAESRRDRG